MGRKNSEEKVSVIMSEYNTPVEHLKLAINSILKQTYKNFEFLIVDDGSCNDLQSIVDAYGDPRIYIIKNRKNLGFVKSLNRAIQASTCELIVRMDTDDISPANRIERLVSFMDKNSEYAVVSSLAMEFSGNANYGTIGRPGKKTKKDIMRGDVPVHAAAIMRKSVIKKAGGYRDYNRAEDLALWLELMLRNENIYVLNEVLYYYRVNPADYSKRTLSKRRGELAARMHYYSLLGAGPVEYGRIIKSVVAGVLPTGIVRRYRNRFVLGRGDGE